MKSISLPLASPAKPLEDNARAAGQPIKGEEYSFADYRQFHYPGTQLLLPEKKSLALVKRFLVLVPAESFPVADFLFQIHQYTAPGMTLLFVSRVADPDQEMVARRQLILMENLARSPRIQVQSRVVFTPSWMKAIQEIWREGDLIICLEDHLDQPFLFKTAPLGRAVFSKLQVPVLIHPGIHLWERPTYPKTVREIAAWFSFLLTISLFTYLQIRVSPSLPDWPGRLFLIFSLLVEVFLIWKINDFFC